jgi:hypothetical protein
MKIKRPVACRTGPSTNGKESIPNTHRHINACRIGAMSSARALSLSYFNQQAATRPTRDFTEILSLRRGVAPRTFTASFSYLHY